LSDINKMLIKRRRYVGRSRTRSFFRN